MPSSFSYLSLSMSMLKEEEGASADDVVIEVAEMVAGVPSSLAAAIAAAAADLAALAASRDFSIRRTES